MFVKWWICPCCNASYSDFRSAERCRNSHQIKNQTWLMCNCGWGVRADMNAQADEEFQKHKKGCNYIVVEITYNTKRKDDDMPKGCGTCKHESPEIHSPCDTCDEEYSEWEDKNEN